MANATIANLSAKTTLRGGAPVVAKQARTIAGRRALKVENNVKLVHVRQNTAQKIASMSGGMAGYIAYEAQDIEFVKSKLVVGADTSPGTSIDVLIPVSTVSSTHCFLMATKDTVLVKDLGSTNGTSIDGVAVKGDVCVALVGQTISFDEEKGIAFTVQLDTSVDKDMSPKMVAAAKAETFAGLTSEATLAARVEERGAWISKFRAASAAAPFTSEAGLGERVEERSAWISAHRKPTGAFTSEAPLAERVEERAAWIAGNRAASKPAATGAFTSEAALGDRVEERSSWIAAHRGASKPTDAFTSEAALGGRVEERSSWIKKHRTATAATGSSAGSSGKKLKVAINGFGRIGRNFVRCLASRGPDAPIEIVAINDSGGVKQAAHLLKYDSILGTFNADIQITGDDTMTVNGTEIKVVSNRNPLELPWAALGVDIVIESTGVFIDEEGAGKHITAGAKKVVITAPGKGAIPTYVMGVNAHNMTGDEPIISNASCTTNGMASFVMVLQEQFGIVKGMMTTTHSYTGDQRLLDNSHRDARRARAAALNIVPTSTGAAKAVALVLPSVKGKLNGIALRVPTPNVSVVDLVVQVERKTTAEEVNAAFREAAAGPLKGILAVSDEPLVGSDFKGTNVSSSVDSALTMVMGEDYVKVVAWYDNEWGYTQRVVDLTLQFAQRGF